VIVGKHLLIADDEVDFSRRVIELLRDPQRAQTLAAAARGLAVEMYSWERLISNLEPKLADLVRRTGRTAQEGMRHTTLQG
jgi:glycosyltransferase involved in cell wall biosynthesis